MTKFVVKNGNQKDTCDNDIAICAQNINTVLDSIANTIWEDICDRSQRETSLRPTCTGFLNM